MTDKVSQSHWWVYIIQTHNESYYTGITTDLTRRFEEHLQVYEGVKKARGAKFFRTVKPLRIIHQEAFANRSEASKRERQIKRMSRTEKERLVLETKPGI